MIRRVAMAFVVLAGALAMPAGVGAQIDGKAVQAIKPEDMKWVKNAAGTQETVTLFGDQPDAFAPLECEVDARICRQEMRGHAEVLSSSILPK